MVDVMKIWIRVAEDWTLATIHQAGSQGVDLGFFGDHAPEKTGKSHFIGKYRKP